MTRDLKHNFYGQQPRDPEHDIYCQQCGNLEHQYFWQMTGDLEHHLHRQQPRDLESVRRVVSTVSSSVVLFPWWPCCWGICFECRRLPSLSQLGHISGARNDTPVAALPDAFLCGISARTGWPCVSLLWLGETASLIGSFCFLVAVNIDEADMSLRYTLPVSQSEAFSQQADNPCYLICTLYSAAIAFQLLPHIFFYNHQWVYFSCCLVVGLHPVWGGGVGGGEDTKCHLIFA